MIDYITVDVNTNSKINYTYSISSLNSKYKFLSQAAEKNICAEKLS